MVSRLGMSYALHSSCEYKIADFDVSLHFSGQNPARLRRAEIWFRTVLAPFRVAKARRLKGHVEFGVQAGEAIAHSHDRREILLGGRTSYSEAVSVSQVSNTLSFYYRLPTRGAEDVGYMTHAEEATLDYAVTRSSNKIWFHAACLAQGESLVFLVAPSGYGKTTLSLGLVSHGFRLATDDIVLFDMDKGCLIPCPRCPRIRGTALSQLARIGVDLRVDADLTGRYVILPQSHFQLTSPPARRDAIHVFILARGESSVSESLTDLSPSRGIIEITKNSNLLSQDPELQFFENVFGEASFYRLKIGDYGQNISELMAAVAR